MSLNEKKKKHDETSDQQKTHSKTNYEDCFVYDESRFTGNFEVKSGVTRNALHIVIVLIKYKKGGK